MQVSAEETGHGAAVGFGCGRQAVLLDRRRRARSSGPCPCRLRRAIARGGRCLLSRRPSPPAARTTARRACRPHYHANYYAAFVLDPDGNNVEAVCHASSLSRLKARLARTFGQGELAGGHALLALLLLPHRVLLGLPVIGAVHVLVREVHPASLPSSNTRLAEQVQSAFSFFLLFLPKMEESLFVSGLLSSAFLSPDGLPADFAWRRTPCRRTSCRRIYSASDFVASACLSDFLPPDVLPSVFSAGTGPVPV